MRTVQKDPPETPSFTAHFATNQNWAEYTSENHRVWSILYERRMADLERTGSQVFLEGAEIIALRAETVPDIRRVNEKLNIRTGWNAFPVRGFIPAGEFFRCLAIRLFPTTVTMRRMEQLEYLPEPDIFHDVFGHVPLHADPSFADFLQSFGQVAAMASKNPDQVTAMARLFWFTVEFGLIREGGEVRTYGSGLVSSAGDAANALSDGCDRRPFRLDNVIEQPFEVDRFQDVLFVIDSFEQIVDALDEMKGRLGARA